MTMSKQSAAAIIDHQALTVEHPTLQQVQAALGRELTAAEYAAFCERHGDIASQNRK